MRRGENTAVPETPTLRGAIRARFAVTAADGTELSVLVATPDSDSATAADPELPPVFAVHGFASNAADGWGRTGHLDTLARAGRTVIAPDLRGHGRSGKPHDAGAYTIDLVLDDLRRVVAGAAERLVRPPDSLDLLGYSLGSRLSWTLACRRLLPVRRMVLGGFDGRALFEGVDTEWLAGIAARLDRNDQVALRYLVEGLQGTGGIVDGAPLPELPTLVVAGDADDLARRAAEFAARLPRGEFLSVPDRDHISAVPAQVFRRGVVTFLGRADRRLG